ncbi:MAG: PIN domain-containing protein [Nitrospirae bacterium]|nr:PIN domain-containing protein [Nitrospirota bacterium]
MSRSIFIDTTAWLALINKSDDFFNKACSIRDELLKDGCHFFVTNYIIVEIANSLSRKVWRNRAISLINFIYNSDDIEVIEVNKEIYNQALEIYKHRQDKEWGLTDCTSFIVMSTNGIAEAFTNDRHFEQAGFIALLK